MYAQVRLQLTGAVVPSKMELSVLSLKTSKGAFPCVKCTWWWWWGVRWDEMRWVSSCTMNYCHSIATYANFPLQCLHICIWMQGSNIYPNGCIQEHNISLRREIRRAGSCLIVGPSWQIRALLFVVNSSCCGICLHCRKTKQAEKRGEAKADDADTSLWEEASAKHACLNSDPDTSTNYVGST